MKIEITIPTPSAKLLKSLTLGLIVVLAGVLFWQRGLSALLLFLAFCLLLLAVGLAWASVTTFSDRETLTLDEALDVAAPARDEERKLAVLRGIKDLEYERSLGKISERDYTELMQRYRGDAKALLQKLDTTEASLRQRALELATAKLSQSKSAERKIESQPVFEPAHASSSGSDNFAKSSASSLPATAPIPTSGSDALPSTQGKTE